MSRREHERAVEHLDLVALMLLRALDSGDGCPICQLAAETCESTLWSLLWENVNDPAVRARIREALGFCPRHTLRLCQVADAEGLGVTGPAIIFADVLATMAGGLRVGQRDLRAAGPCPICAHERTSERGALSTLLRHAEHPRIAALMRRRGLCQPHYCEAQALAGRRDDLRAPLAALQARHLDRWAASLTSRAAGEIASAGAAWLRGEAPWPPARPSQRPSGRRSTAEQAARVAARLRAQVSCPVCLEVGQRHAARLDRWLRALADDAAARAAFVAAGGVCRDHATALAALSVETQRELYGGAWAAARRVLAADLEDRRVWARRRQHVEPVPPCPLCAELEREASALAAMSSGQPLPEAGAYCLPHLRLALAATPSQPAAALRAAQAERLRALGGQLAELLRKSAWQHRHEPQGDEQGSWARAAAFFAAPLLMREAP